MRHFLVMLMVAVMGFGLAVDHAEARRMGGGGKIGSFSRSAERPAASPSQAARSEEHTSELQSRPHLVCRLLLEKKKQITTELQLYNATTPSSPMLHNTPLRY